MTTNIDDIPVPVQERLEYLRLKDMKIGVPSAEQRANWNDPENVHAVLTIEWEPVSYRIEGGLGNVVIERLNVSQRLTADEAASVVRNGWNGIPAGKINRNKGANPNSPFEMWMRARKDAGLDVEITADGQVSSPQVGRVFEVGNASREFRWGETWLRLPRRLADDYVPPTYDQLPVRVIGGRTGEAAAVTVAPVPTTADTGKIRAQLAEGGFIGMPVEEANKTATTVIMGKSLYDLLSEGLAQAAQQGKFAERLVELGAATVDNGVLA